MCWPLFGWVAVNEIVFPVVLTAAALLGWLALREPQSRLRPPQKSNKTGDFRGCAALLFLAMSARFWGRAEALPRVRPWGKAAGTGRRSFFSSTEVYQ